MLLIIGSDNDPNTQRVADHSYIQDINYIQIDPSLPEYQTVQWTFGDRHLLLNGNPSHPNAVYLRHDVFSAGVEVWSTALVRTVSAFLLANPQVRMLNRNSMLRENNKTSNLLLAHALGMQIPKTTVFAGAPMAMKVEFAGEDVIAKPSHGGDYAARPADLPEDTMNYASAFVQERLPGTNYRVFVIGGEVFGFEVKSDMLDYRVDECTQVIESAPPAPVAVHSVAMAQACHFDYCALDFRLNGQGEWVFLEINSFPMFSVFDDSCKNRLVEAQLAFLMKNAT